jgi:hypothetical protein
MADYATLIRAMRSAVGWVERSETLRRPLGWR